MDSTRKATERSALFARNSLLLGVLSLFAAPSAADRFGREQFVGDPTLGNDVHPADLDGDGDLDLVTGGPSWYENTDGEGTFLWRGFLTEDHAGEEMFAVADMDGDGDLDVVVANLYEDTVTWYPNVNGRGAFGARRPVMAATYGLHSVFVADLDGDGDPDVLVNDEPSWYENLDGTGTFGPEQSLDGQGLDGRRTIAADVDGDGDLDVLVAAYDDGRIFGFENMNGHGVFGPRRTITNVVDGAVWVAAADLDGDGDLDVLSASTGDSKIAWYENRGGFGRFGPQQIITTLTHSPRVVRTADLDGDGDLDVLAVGYNEGEVTWHENVDGLGSFGPRIVVAELGQYVLSGVFPADLDGDGDQDVLSVCHWDLLWSRNADEEATFDSAETISSTIPSPRSTLTADLDGDGDPDVVVGYGKIAWCENLGAATAFGRPRYVTTESGSYHLSAGDIDGDGDVDLFSADGLDDEIEWYENIDGQGSFGPERVITTRVGQPEWVHAADLDGDGDLDVVSASPEDYKVAWYENLNGLGNFGRQRIISTSEDLVSFVTAADIDGDGDLDLIVASGNWDGLVWFENWSGLGTAWPRHVIHPEAVHHAAAAADFDGDGDLDIVAAPCCGKVSWYENLDGLGTFGPERIITTLVEGPSVLVAADLDGDGDEDVLSASRIDDKVAWYENVSGHGFFGPQEILSTTARSVHDARIVDMDGDGDHDVLFAARLNSKLAWFENRGRFARTTLRNAGTNPESYHALVPPRLGTTFVATVDLAGTTGHEVALLVGYRGDLQVTLRDGQVLLVDLSDPQGEILGLAPRAGPVATFEVPIPPDVSLVTVEIFTQAQHVGGGLPFALSNAQDLYLGL